MLPFLLTLLAADTCRFDLPGAIYRSPDGTVMAQPLLDRSAVDSVGVYFGWMYLAPGALVAEHTHDDAEKMVSVVCGTARFRLNEEEIALEPGMSLRIPRGRRHAALVGASGVVLVQVYRPGGPGGRFYGWDRVPAPPE